MLISNEPFRTRVSGGRRLTPTNSKLYSAIFQGLTALVSAYDLFDVQKDDLTFFSLNYQAAIDQVAIEEYRAVRDFIRVDGTDWKSNVRPYVNKNRLKDQIRDHF